MARLTVRPLRMISNVNSGWLVGLVRFVCQCLTSARLRPARVELKAGHAGAAAGACRATNIKVSRIFKNQLSLESAELRPLVG